ncbi:hypothetical protein ACFVZH_25650 [Streptomyces sp. NPDC059534]|uniref:hypothetical protein n=1 Tax=Streptomyces sp. NPDC059534 TaxID=3346859 RepID=UPI00367D71BE
MIIHSTVSGAGPPPAGNAAGGAPIARVGGEHPAAFRARLRTFVNLGVVVGTLGAAFAIQINTRPAYTGLILANAASFAFAGLIALLGVPNYRPLPRPKEHRQWSVLADRPYVSFVALSSAMGLQYQTVSLLLPIWLSAHTDAPRWTVAAVYAVNSGVCVLLRSRLGSTVETPRQGGRAFRLVGVFFACLGAAGPPLAAWAECTRPGKPGTEEGRQVTPRCWTPTAEVALERPASRGRRGRSRTRPAVRRKGPASHRP